MHFDGKKLAGIRITLVECVLVWSFKDVKVFNALPQPSKSQIYVLLLLFSAPEKIQWKIS